jgi:hypothetical protein
MAITYEPIATTTLTSTAAFIQFTSITGAYTDLRLVASLRTNRGGGAAADALRGLLNGGASTSGTFVNGNGSTASSARHTASWLFNSVGTLGSTAISIACATQATGIFSLLEMDIFNYSSTSVNKTLLATCSSDFNGSGYVQKYVGMDASTSAITSIYLASANGNSFIAGCTATLYGILKA